MGIGGWELTDEEFERYYGPWAQRTPRDVATLFTGYPGVWWIAGGWAIEAFTGVPRDHDDIDPSVLRVDFEMLRDQLRGRYQLWSCSSGMHRPVFESLPAGDDRLHIEGSGQVWLRQSAVAPWEYDVLLAPGDATEWVYKRDQSIRMPMAQALWTKDGIRYLKPEIQLLYKAAGRRPKDQTDFDACLPLLEHSARKWLHGNIIRTLDEGHPWVAPLRHRLA